MKLHNDKIAFRELVLATAQNTSGLQAYQVEKDYFVSLFLKELSRVDTEYEIVFKGGTSLSKCYSVIDRFSEDIDLSIKFKNENATKRVRRRLKDKIVRTIDNLGMTFINPEDVESNRDFNNYEIEYEKAFDRSSEMLPFIKVETIAVYKPYPIEKLEVGNYITNYLETIDEGKNLIAKYNLEKFKMNVQTIERTFIDKVFAVCDYKIQNMMDRDSRHLYDIAKILPKINLDDNLKEIVKAVRLDRSKSKNNPSAKIDSLTIGKILEKDFKGLDFTRTITSTRY